MRKKQRYTVKQKTGIKAAKPKVKIVFLLLLIFTFFFLVIKKPFRMSSKEVFAVNQQNGDVHIHIIDPDTKDYSIVRIPGKTQVEASKNLGQWKIQSLWKLGMDEGVGGQILVKSLTKSIGIPVYQWADYKAEGFTKGGYYERFLATFSGYKTNIPFTDRIAIGLFTFSIKDAQRNFIDLEQSNFLTDTKLVDGTEGFLVTGNYPNKLLPILIDRNIAVSESKIKLIDSGASNSSIAAVVRIIEVIGGKVSLVERSGDDKAVCEVYSKDERVSTFIGNLYNCNIVQEITSEDNFDLIIELGTNFENTN